MQSRDSGPDSDHRKAAAPCLPDSTAPPTVPAAHSVAGEEDPGACNDLATTAVAPLTSPGRAPGDEAAAGTPGTGDDVCPRCGGSGRSDGTACPACEGSGRVVKAIGGA